MSSAEPGSNSGAAVENVEKQRVRNVTELPSVDEFILTLIATLDPLLEDVLEDLHPLKSDGWEYDPSIDLVRVAGGILGAMRLNDWSYEEIVKYVVQHSGGRLPHDILERTVDRNEELLTFVKSRPLPDVLPSVEIYGETFRLGDGLPDLSFIWISNGWTDRDGLYGMWRVEQNSRDQWDSIMKELKERGVENVESICLNLPYSHILEEEGFVEAVLEHFSGAEPFAVTEGMYVS